MKKLINKHQVEYAKTLLIDNVNQHDTLETIDEIPNFNSRSTFNKSFKEIVGVTPTEFQNEHLN